MMYSSKCPLIRMVTSLDVRLALFRFLHTPRAHTPKFVPSTNFVPFHLSVCINPSAADSSTAVPSKKQPTVLPAPPPAPPSLPLPPHSLNGSISMICHFSPPPPPAPPSPAREKKKDLFEMTSAERKRYQKVFSKLSPDGGAISPATAASTLAKSGLPREMLRRIWAMADVERYWRLNV